MGGPEPSKYGRSKGPEGRFGPPPPSRLKKRMFDFVSFVEIGTRAVSCLGYLVANVLDAGRIIRALL